MEILEKFEKLFLAISLLILVLIVDSAESVDQRKLIYFFHCAANFYFPERNECVIVMLSKYEKYNSRKKNRTINRKKKLKTNILCTIFIESH